MNSGTMQTNMSNLTDLDMHDQFAKPQSNGAALLKNSVVTVSCIYVMHIVFMHTALVRSNNVKSNRLEKQFKKRERTANEQMFRAVGCNQMTFLATRSAA